MRSASLWRGRNSTDCTMSLRRREAFRLWSYAVSELANKAVED